MSEACRARGHRDWVGRGQDVAGQGHKVPATGGGRIQFPRGGGLLPLWGDGMQTLTIRTERTSETRGPGSEVTENQAGPEASGRKLLSLISQQGCQCVGSPGTVWGQKIEGMRAWLPKVPGLKGGSRWRHCQWACRGPQDFTPGAPEDLGPAVCSVGAKASGLQTEARGRGGPGRHEGDLGPAVRRTSP